MTRIHKLQKYQGIQWGFTRLHFFSLGGKHTGRHGFYNISAAIINGPDGRLNSSPDITVF